METTLEQSIHENLALLEEKHDIEFLEICFSLKSLLYSNTKLTHLDISNNLLLEYLYCPYNQLEKLDISKNIELEYLYCHYNKLKNLNIRNNPKLMYLDCQNNPLTKIIITKTQKEKIKRL